MNIFVSILIPAFNESINIPIIYQELIKELTKRSDYYEILFVDDGSTDNTLEQIQKLASSYSEVKYLSFTRNFGKEPAIYAGLQHARGDAVIIMDADLQHPTHMIHPLIDGFKEGFDQVIAQRNRIGESFMRSRLSCLYYSIMKQFVEVDLKDGQGDFRLLSRRAVNTVLTMGERYRFSKGLFSWIGYNQKVIMYDNHARGKGESKWSLKKLIDYGIEGVASFNHKPLRLCLYTGFITLFLAILYIFFIFGEFLINGISVPGYFTTISSVLFLGGIQLVSLGIIGEYVGRIYHETKQRPLYITQYSNIGRKKNVHKFKTK
ncbi:glycosyltransferase [Lysinibacillus yapensis]|uniref:Glycosyltransferase n=1 Tax=Ureibacillus yapensis TaxID=2304605 RepID=A0A396S2I3_9BACL|nr:glycosyltransferase family 2 protein [Lysinibacillus yapensis]RHW31374.1 glycosyltransferase [Lysinibacillus yapensis]